VFATFAIVVVCIHMRLGQRSATSVSNQIVCGSTLSSHLARAIDADEQ
jgi:hypothetical protein